MRDVDPDGACPHRMWATGKRLCLYVGRLQGDGVEVIDKGSNSVVAGMPEDSRGGPWSTCRQSSRSGIENVPPFASGRAAVESERQSRGGQA